MPQEFMNMYSCKKSYNEMRFVFKYEIIIIKKVVKTQLEEKLNKTDEEETEQKTLTETHRQSHTS